MDNTLDILTQKTLTNLQNDLSDLKTNLSGLAASCAIRHRLNLTAEISKLAADINNLDKLLHDNYGLIEGNQLEITNLKKDLTEITSKVNILMLKVDDLTLERIKSKDNKTNFILQILIVVFAFIITSLIGCLSTLAWNALSETPINKQAILDSNSNK